MCTKPTYVGRSDRAPQLTVRSYAVILGFAMPNALDPQSLQAIEKAIHSDRLKRYRDGGEYDPTAALVLYLWNARLCESFYFPLQVAEIVVRNAIHNAVVHRYGDDWWSNAHFIGELKRKYQDDLSMAIADERAKHGKNLTKHHIVSVLSFGFWQNLTTTRFRHLLWKRGLKHQFPNAPVLPVMTTVQDLHDKIQLVRQWRNRVAHHQAIFDKQPDVKHQEVILLVDWVCKDTAAFVSRLSNFGTVWGAKPVTPMPSPQSPNLIEATAQTPAQ